MRIVVTRQASQDTGTPGRLVVDEIGFSADTLELPWRNNEKSVSCIIADEYDADVAFSEHLQRNVLRLEDKHGRSACLIHNGNWAGDASLGYVTQVHGCTLIGDGYAQIRLPSGARQFGIINSSETLDAFLNAIGDGPHTVCYEWADGCAPE